MTPDEHVCTTCEDEGAVGWVRVVLPLSRRAQDEINNSLVPASLWADYGWPLVLIDAVTEGALGVDTCPECGRGGEVGKL